ncbi:1-deoxy-D-xylulose-5-phosphate reductoisomerase [Woodsholea maritima]|uniref:1-deoxy-D-xylulose-5-phosphate reductoisomerase n=1 Tax=Woodsholea maritima TaxID=240237 RepID=UPI000382CE20|nr:1-deoxy-D-xylulose-5-phosphate reductoisomerase [Woodsholea maritima]
MTKRITVLGATGSIGEATLDLVRANRDQFEVVALTANTRVEDLIALALEFRPQCVALGDTQGADRLASALAGSGIDWAVGEEAVIDAARRPADWTMAAIVGAAGLKPTLAAAEQGGAIALANKEALVCSGVLFLDTCARFGTRVLPVDSEHNAIAQALANNRRHDVRKIVLTASGGPFRSSSLAEMGQASVETALAHPTWSMGAKISIDSATMMNKGLEIIEACHLFDLEHNRVEVLVHPDSIVHGLVEYCDGSWLAQLGSPDMRTPIAHALAFPQRMAADIAPLDLAKIGTLRFEAPDELRFPALRLARDAFAAGGGLAAVLNSANEVAVAAFLNGHIGFLEIAQCVETCLDQATKDGLNQWSMTCFEEVFSADTYGRDQAGRALQALMRA